MATPISKTWLELKNLSGGSSCKQVEAMVTPLYPGLNDATVIDALTWCEQFRTAGMIHYLYPSIVRGMTGVQQRDLVVWLMQRLSNNLPAGWSRTPTLTTKIAEIIDCLNAPTAGKKAALQTFSSSLSIDYNDERDGFMADLLRKVINLMVSGTTGHSDVSSFAGYVIRGATNIAGTNEATVLGVLLDRIELIIGVV